VRDCGGGREEEETVVVTVPGSLGCSVLVVVGVRECEVGRERGVGVAVTDDFSGPSRWGEEVEGGGGRLWRSAGVAWLWGLLEEE
jgi:hypothetical protein